MIRIDVRIANKQNEKNLLTELEVEEVFNLIESNKDISKIAGKEDWKFTKGILKKWCINNSEDGKRVLLIALVKYKKIHTDTEKIIGFCTLTNKEADFLQNRDIELCHVIVDKNYRRILNGTKMVYNVIDIAFNLNYDSIYGRVFNDNEIGRSFIKHLNWTQIDIQDKECVWYVYKNKSERFSSIIFKRMLELDRMSIAQLSDLLGMSKQYIGSLKNPLVGQSTKLPSPQLLNQLCLILGQRSGAIFRQFYTDNKNVVKWKNFNEYLTSIEEDKGFNRLYENLDYEVINKILLSYAQLQRIESGFIFGESRIGLNEKEIIDNEFSNKNKETSRDDYEIWTLSDTLAEQLDIKYAESTIKNILDYKITYRYFVSINDKTNWRLSLKNLLSVYEKMIQDYAYSNNWGKSKPNNIDQYIHIYGIPENMLYVKFRIYDAKSNNSIGNLNIGGVSEDDFKFIELPRDIKSRISDILNNVLVCEQIGDSEIIDVYDYSMQVEKKYPYVN